MSLATQPCNRSAVLLQNNIPNEAKLVEAFDRLAKYGLIKAEGAGIALTAPAQEIITGIPRKAETPERLFAIKDRLSAYNVKGEHAQPPRGELGGGGGGEARVSEGPPAQRQARQPQALTPLGQGV